MRKIYSLLLVLLMAVMSIGSAQASQTIASGDGWKLCKITSDDAGMSKYVGKKILYITSDQASKSYSSASACPWSSYASQVDAAAFTLQYSGSKRIGAYMFANMVNLTEVQINWSGNSSSSTTYAIGAHAFEGCSNLKELRSMGAKSIGDYAFKGCTNLEMVYAHPQLTSIGAHAFEECSSFKDFMFFWGGTPRFAVGDYAFCKCSSMTSFYGTYITSVGEYGFANCALTSIDLENCTTISERAFNKNKLSYVHFGSAITSIGENAFYNGLVDNGNVVIHRSAPPTTASNAFSYNNLSTITLDCPAGNAYNVAPWNQFKKRTLDSELYGIISGTTFTIYYDGSYISRNGARWWDFNNSWDLTMNQMNSVTKVVFDSSVAAARLTSTSLLFGNYFTELITIEGLEYLNTSEVTSMSSMFRSCKKLTAIDVSHFNTSKCTSMNSMFSGCKALTTLNVNSFDMSQVTDAGFMFEGCINLQRIYCEKDWTNVSMSYAFFSCTSLVGGWGTPFDENYKNAQYARPDGGSAAPGYFWRAGDTGEEEEEIIEPVDERVIISEIELKDFDRSGIKAGETWTAEWGNNIASNTHLVDGYAPYEIFGGELLYASTLDEVTAGTELTAGTYIFSIGVWIKPGYEDQYRFRTYEEGPVTATVNGEAWSADNVYGDSYLWISSPVFNISDQGIDNVQTDKVQSTKVIRDGQLYIIRGDKTFNALGVEVK